MNKSAEDEFRSFVDGNWPRLLRTAHLLTGHHQDAEDLVQAALARAYTRWERILGARSPEAYVWRILINTNADRLRRRKLGEWLTHWLPERSAPDCTDRLVERDVLLAALRALPVRQRATVVLRYLEDRSESEVAELLGTSVGTVRSQTARALTRLRAEVPRLTASERP
ncbi:SigE family RNA polymerase sigma factor [Streptomyces sp. HMX87]|uniref:SigE family RNA polymerase sigma factor n=1 Tax=Streptomyces sp. HMX87 TaxID=3390849 RepID=UPI003A870300